VPPDVLSPGQGAHLEIYSIWTLQRGELATDDSFAFNKVRRAGALVGCALPGTNECKTECMCAQVCARPWVLMSERARC
jgi:hypothetical protein